MYTTHPGSRGPILPSTVPYQLQILVGIAIVAACLFWMNEESQAKNWPTASGALLTISTDQRSLTYGYHVGKQFHEVQQFHVPINHDIAHEVRIAYDPKNEAHGVVREEHMPMLFCVCLAGGLLTLYSFFQLTGGAMIDVGLHSTWRN